MIDDLIARLKTTDKGNRELDCIIFLHANKGTLGRSIWDKDGRYLCTEGKLF